MPEDKSRASSTIAVPAVLADSAGFLLNRAAGIIREAMSESLKPLHLSPQEMGLLRLVDAGSPQTQQALSKKNNIDRTTMVQLLDGLEERQLLMRQSDPADRRANLICLTPRGRKTLSQALRRARAQQQKFLSPLSEAEWETLRGLLVKLLEHHLGDSTPG
jgi:MarR family transcriptional regulator, lower aerobic nicotinate degradation pathway regulator